MSPEIINSECIETENEPVHALEEGEVNKSKAKTSSGSKPEIPPGMSKNAWKREQKKKKWLEQKEARNKYKKDKKKQKKLKNKMMQEQLYNESGSLTTIDDQAPSNAVTGNNNELLSLKKSNVNIIVDCAFDDFMTEKEVVSLSAQITRSYSENRKAACTVNLKITSLDKRLLQRFDTALKGQYKQWKGVEVSHDPYIVPEDEIERRKYIYLSSDSSEVLESLDEGCTYIIGGIVDKGRHKNLCFNKANEQQIRTAKLPISEYIKISGRQVLTTNHVVEIMLKWLECHNWKTAFEAAMPPRKIYGFESARQKRKRLASEEDSR
ncbi:guanine-1-methyltransferase-domain-containing protein [Dipodascopsis uninucleata]